MGQRVTRFLHRNGEKKESSRAILTNSPQVTSIRSEEKYSISSALMTPGQVLQVLSVSEDSHTSPRKAMKCHHILCKNVSNFLGLLDLVQRAIHSTNLVQLKSQNAVHEIRTVLKTDHRTHHIFVFYKCESLRISGHDLEFLNFIASIANLYWEEHLLVSVIFTTYMKFNIVGRNTELVQVGMLSDPLDILSLLEQYAPGVDVTEYVQLCLNLFGFPEGIIRISDVFLKNYLITLCSLCLKEFIINDVNFLTAIFSKREVEVRNWICESDLVLIMRCHPQMSMLFTEDYLREVYEYLNPTHNYYQWTTSLARLRDNHVIIESPGTQQLTFHPLVIYFCMTRPALDGQSKITTTSDWNKQFLWRVLNKGEDYALAIERRYRYYGRWHELRPLLEKAIYQNSQDGSFSAFCKVLTVFKM
ncbi:hypothetical protein Btru_053828 [Bulinus truncatus]|nr:hypothetical protein Btru_053828 [Bulinus truncatus]